VIDVQVDRIAKFRCFLICPGKEIIFRSLPEEEGAQPEEGGKQLAPRGSSRPEACPGREVYLQKPTKEEEAQPKEGSRQLAPTRPD
jgi:hypothetical protein